jgi:hypothetical protein
MKREEQTVKTDIKAPGRSKKQNGLKNETGVTERAAELPAKEASVAAEMKNRSK